MKRSGSGILRRRGSSTPKSPLLGEGIPKEIIDKREKLWKRIYEYQGMDKEAILSSIASHMEFTLFSNRNTAVDSDVFYAVALAVRDRLIEFANDCEDNIITSKCKKAYYLSLEYLMGRSLLNNLLCLGLYDTLKEALDEIGYDLGGIEELEKDPGLGNGGLGRLAACFLDSLATHNYPVIGYGIRYVYGTFSQRIENGEQREYPDNWLEKGHPWELPRWDRSYEIKFGGKVESFKDYEGRWHFAWVSNDNVVAQAYDVLIPGYETKQVNILRLWSSRASNEFNFQKFNEGSYSEAVADKMQSENICKVLYPNDKTLAGKYLRLKQQYFFVSASIQDIIRDFRRDFGFDWSLFPKKVAIQLNDTHPTIAVPELLRIFLDVYHLTWEEAWSIGVKVFAYTNHTVLPEALEKWPVSMLESLLPRHLELVYEINRRHLEEVNRRFPGDLDLRRRISLFEDEGEKRLRMSNLAIVGSHTINGVAELHSTLLKSSLFRDFYILWPEKFTNVTNGVTPRRWLRNANPDLAELINSAIGKEWVKDLSQLKKLEKFADQPEFQARWREVKLNCKEKLGMFLRNNYRIFINPESILDVQVKRIHEYKRQLLNVLFCISRYNYIKANPLQQVVPRTVLFGGKAAPGYHMAKLIIHLINDVAEVINNDPVVDEKLKVYFLENFGVSLGEKVYPAADISEQISTAGLEASGTGNMKFCMNGAVIVGTMDGANVEIYEEVGEENIFIFGLTTDEIAQLKPTYNPADFIESNPDLQHVLEQIRSGFFCPEDPNRYAHIYDVLTTHDNYLLMADYQSYIDAQWRVDEAYLDQERWAKMSIMNVANMGKFSSDRSVQEYASRIWEVDPLVPESGADLHGQNGH